MPKASNPPSQNQTQDNCRHERFAVERLLRLIRKGESTCTNSTPEIRIVIIIRNSERSNLQRGRTCSVSTTSTLLPSHNHRHESISAVITNSTVKGKH